MQLNPARQVAHSGWELGVGQDSWVTGSLSGGPQASQDPHRGFVASRRA